MSDVRPPTMQLETQQDCEAVNKRFNGFHDGFIRELRWQSPLRFLTSMPWEQPRSFSSNEEWLLATGTTPIGEESLSLLISHYNYDWPNQPNTRVVAILLTGRIYVEHQISAGLLIDGLEFAREQETLACTIRWQLFGPPDDRPISESYFYAENIRISEIKIDDASPA